MSALHQYYTIMHYTTVQYCQRTFPGPAAGSCARSTAGACAFSGNMAWPWRPRCVAYGISPSFICSKFTHTHRALYCQF